MDRTGGTCVSCAWSWGAVGAGANVTCSWQVGIDKIRDHRLTAQNEISFPRGPDGDTSTSAPTVKLNDRVSAPPPDPRL